MLSAEEALDAKMKGFKDGEELSKKIADDAKKLVKQKIKRLQTSK